MKYETKRKGRFIKITLYLNRKNVYHNGMEKLLRDVTLDPFAKLRFTNDVDAYLENADHYIETSKTFKINQFYKCPDSYIIGMKKKVYKEVKRHLENMI